MTLPDERARAVIHTRSFLLKLIYTPSNGGYARVPPEVKKMAQCLLRHYPSSFDINRAAEKAPDIFDKIKVEEPSA